MFVQNFSLFSCEDVVWGWVVALLFQGASARQLCPMEEKVLDPLQDECQCWDRRAGPVRVPRVCQKGTVGSFSSTCRTLVRKGPIPAQRIPIATHHFLLDKWTCASKYRISNQCAHHYVCFFFLFCRSGNSFSNISFYLLHVQELKGGKAYAKVSFSILGFLMFKSHLEVI